MESDFFGLSDADCVLSARNLVRWAGFGALVALALCLTGAATIFVFAWISSYGQVVAQPVSWVIRDWPAPLQALLGLLAIGAAVGMAALLLMHRRREGRP